LTAYFATLPGVKFLWGIAVALGIVVEALSIGRLSCFAVKTPYRASAVNDKGDWPHL
jgi:hypothetical protein